ncbi:MAG: sugar phosphate isomerase/epimerase family protein [Clostridia bacterium]
MKIGYCTNVKFENGAVVIPNYEYVKQCNFDYLEISLSNITSFSEEEFVCFKKFLADEQIEVPATMGLLPGGMFVVGPKGDFDKFKNFVDLALDRASQIGAKNVVFGAGGARNIPGGFDRNVAVEQFDKALSYVSDLASTYGITICLEALHLRETNFISTFKEGAEYVYKIDKPSLKTVLDFFHFNVGREPLSLVEESKDIISHVHYARTLGRAMPLPSDFEEVANHLSYLKKIGYNDLVSFECQGGIDQNQVDDCVKTVELFKNYFK